MIMNRIQNMTNMSGTKRMYDIVSEEARNREKVDVIVRGLLRKEKEIVYVYKELKNKIDEINRESTMLPVYLSIHIDNINVALSNIKEHIKNLEYVSRPKGVLK